MSHVRLPRAVEPYGMRPHARLAGDRKFRTTSQIAGRAHGNLLHRKINPATLFQILIIFLGFVLFQGHAYARTYDHKTRPQWLRFTATAYSVSGETKAQTITQEGRTLAADPHMLPIGTVVEIRDAGPYSGQYVVSDTGQDIVGRRLDIYIARTHEAIQFGKRRVKVRVLKPAPPTPREQRKAAAEASIAPKPPKDERVSSYYQYPETTTQTSSVE